MSWRNLPQVTLEHQSGESKEAISPEEPDESEEINEEEDEETKDEGRILSSLNSFCGAGRTSVCTLAQKDEQLLEGLLHRYEWEEIPVGRFGVADRKVWLLSSRRKKQTHTLSQPSLRV